MTPASLVRIVTSDSNIIIKVHEGGESGGGSLPKYDGEHYVFRRLGRGDLFMELLIGVYDDFNGAVECRQGLIDAGLEKHWDDVQGKYV